MNQIIEQMMTRCSIREFTGQPVKEEDLKLILTAAQQAPTSINAQQISLIVTRDKQVIKRIAEIAGGQPQVANADLFITLVIDFNRTQIAANLSGAQHVIQRSAEGIVVGALDAGIMLNAIQTAANSLGYGSTAIGGIRNDPQAMIELLDLPQNTYPVNGLTLGVPDASKLPLIKPRVPLDSFAMDERYNSNAVQAGVSKYDSTLRQWWDEQGLKEMRSYNEEIAAFYSQVYFPTVAETFKRQGFSFSDN